MFTTNKNKSNLLKIIVDEYINSLALHKNI